MVDLCEILILVPSNSNPLHCRIVRGCVLDQLRGGSPVSCLLSPVSCLLSPVSCLLSPVSPVSCPLSNSNFTVSGTTRRHPWQDGAPDHSLSRPRQHLQHRHY